MQTRIGHVHIRYRVPRDSSGFTVASLEDIVRHRIAEACDRSLADVFENDPTVYVLRRVVSRVALLSQHQTSDAELAEQWGRNLCRAVVRTIVHNSDDDNLVRFENQADFVSCFLTRLATGDAWDRWYFGAFSTYRGLPLDEIVISVLRDNQEFVPEILGRFRKSNALELIINLLSRSSQRDLWQKIIRGAATDAQTTDAFRIFAHAAFEIVDALSLWAGARPSEADLLTSYLRTKPVSPDWTKGTSLADAVSALLRFMVGEGVVNVSSSLTDEQVANLDDLLASRFDWLNVNHLLNSLLSVFESSQRTRSDRAFTLRPVRATPAQKRQLEEMLRLLRTHHIRLTGDSSEAYANLLRLLAVFSDSDTSNANMTALLESVVMSAIALLKSESPHAALQQLQRGEVPFESQATGYFKAVIAAGEPTVRLVAELVQQTGDSTSEHGELIQTECAGLFLLTRVIRDLRLPGALQEAGFESIHPLLVGLSIFIGNPSAWTNDTLDYGAAIWCGIEPESAKACLAELESLNREQFLTTLREIVAGQHLVDESRVLEPIAHVAAHPSSAATIEMLGQLCQWLLATWARWLPGLGHSSSNYLLDNFIRRSGTITLGRRTITVELERRPLDEILKLSGYLDETPPVPWLKNRTIKYRLN